MLLCSHEIVIAHSDRNELGKNYSEEQNTLGAALVKALKSTDETCFELQYGIDNYIVYTVEIQDGWHSMSVVNSSDAYLPLNLMLLASFVAILVTIGILALIMLKSRMKDHLALHMNLQLSSAADI